MKIALSFGQEKIVPRVNEACDYGWGRQDMGPLHKQHTADILSTASNWRVQGLFYIL